MRIKVQCTVATQVDDGPQSVTLVAVSSDDPKHPDAAWAQKVPGASIGMTLASEAMKGQLEQGKKYFVMFVPAE